MLPRVLGGILDAASIGLSRVGDIPTSGLPRMADFAKWVMACEPGLPWKEGEFLVAYRSNLLKAEAQQLSLNPLADVLLQFIKNRTINNGVYFTGAPSQLLNRLQAYDTSTNHKHPAVPSSANWLMNKLSRLNPSLRRIHGLEVVQLDSKRSAKSRVVCVRKVSDANDENGSQIASP